MKARGSLPGRRSSVHTVRRLCATRAEAWHCARAFGVGAPNNNATGGLNRLKSTGTAFASIFCRSQDPSKNGGKTMLRWALIFFIVALIAAFFGFGGVAGAAATVAKILFFGFLVLAAIAVIAGLGTRRAL
jgi:uncharacterized membrane protein YtjA (UPF0391 family)